MTSKIVVNNIEADAGVSTVTFNSNVERGSSNLHSTGLNVNNTFVHSTGIALGAGSTIGAVTGVTTYYGDGGQLTNITSVGGAAGADFNDNVKVRLGTGNDLELYHNGTDSYIANATNNFRIGCTGSTNLKFFTNDSTRWNIDGNGHFIPDSNNNFDIGSSSARVRDLYTGDLNLSNKGRTNEVDNTWGDYTIQEGENDLFLINRRNGKKFKFLLQEVD